VTEICVESAADGRLFDDGSPPDSSSASTSVETTVQWEGEARLGTKSKRCRVLITTPSRAEEVANCVGLVAMLVAAPFPVIYAASVVG
jgi:hypothetical protein